MTYVHALDTSARHVEEARFFRHMRSSLTFNANRFSFGIGADHSECESGKPHPIVGGFFAPFFRGRNAHVQGESLKALRLLSYFRARKAVTPGSSRRLTNGNRSGNFLHGAKAMTKTALSLSDINTTVNHEPRILDVRLGEALGFAHPVNIRKTIRRYQEELERIATVSTVETVKRGQKETAFYLNRKQAAFIAAKSETPNAIDITIHVIEVFDAATSGRSQPEKGKKGQKPNPALFDVDPVYVDVYEHGAPANLFSDEETAQDLKLPIAKVREAIEANERLLSVYGPLHFIGTGKSGKAYLLNIEQSFILKGGLKGKKAEQGRMIAKERA